MGFDLFGSAAVAEEALYEITPAQITAAGVTGTFYPETPTDVQIQETVVSINTATPETITSLTNIRYPTPGGKIIRYRTSLLLPARTLVVGRVSAEILTYTTAEIALLPDSGNHFSPESYFDTQTSSGVTRTYVNAGGGYVESSFTGGSTGGGGGIDAVAAQVLIDASIAAAEDEGIEYRVIAGDMPVLTTTIPPEIAALTGTSAEEDDKAQGIFDNGIINYRTNGTPPWVESTRKAFAEADLQLHDSAKTYTEGVSKVLGLDGRIYIANTAAVKGSATDLTTVPTDGKGTKSEDWVLASGHQVFPDEYEASQTFTLAELPPAGHKGLYNLRKGDAVFEYPEGLPVGYFSEWVIPEYTNPFNFKLRIGNGVAKPITAFNDLVDPDGSLDVSGIAGIVGIRNTVDGWKQYLAPFWSENNEGTPLALLVTGSFDASNAWVFKIVVNPATQGTTPYTNYEVKLHNFDHVDQPANRVITFSSPDLVSAPVVTDTATTVQSGVTGAFVGVDGTIVNGAAVNAGDTVSIVNGTLANLDIVRLLADIYGGFDVTLSVTDSAAKTQEYTL